MLYCRSIHKYCNINKLFVELIINSAINISSIKQYCISTQAIKLYDVLIINPICITKMQS